MTHLRRSHTQRMILWAVSVRPQTASELALKVDVDVSNISRAIAPLMAAGLLFSDSTVKKLGNDAQVYKAHTQHPDPSGEVLAKDRHEAPNLALIVDAVKQAGMPLSVPDIAEFTGLSTEAVRRAVRRKSAVSSRILRIAKWVYIPGKGWGWTPCYSISKGPDAPKPAADPVFSQAEWVKRNKALQQLEQRRARIKAGKTSPLYGHPFAQLLNVAGVSPKKAATQIRETA